MSQPKEDTLGSLPSQKEIPTNGLRIVTKRRQSLDIINARRLSYDSGLATAGPTFSAVRGRLVRRVSSAHSSATRIGSILAHSDEPVNQPKWMGRTNNFPSPRAMNRVLLPLPDDEIKNLTKKKLWITGLLIILISSYLCFLAWFFIIGVKIISPKSLIPLIGPIPSKYMNYNVSTSLNDNLGMLIKDKFSYFLSKSFYNQLFAIHSYRLSLDCIYIPGLNEINLFIKHFLWFLYFWFRNDDFYSYAIIAFGPSIYYFGFLNWLGMKFFKHNV